jgi:hypothetical protein
MRMVRPADVASLVVLLHVVHKGSHIEEPHVTKRTLRVIQDDLSVLVNLSVFQVLLELRLSV